jgi:outer membrane lipoprotein SlyB
MNRYLEGLQSMANQVLAISTSKPEISEHFTPSLKKSILKVGVATFMAATSLLGSNMARADGYQVISAIQSGSSFAGTVNSYGGNVNYNNGSIPGCTVSSPSALGTLAGAGAGGLIGNQFGKGHGKTWMTVGGALVGGMAVAGAQQQRMQAQQAECARQAAMRANQNAYANGMPNPQLPAEPVLYANETANGQIYYVTIEGSIGLNALRGVRDGNLDSHSNAMVGNALDTEERELQNAWVQFDQASQNYMRLAQGSSAATMNARYAVTSQQVRTGQMEVQNEREVLTNALTQYNNAYNQWAKVRSFAASIYDNAAADGYHLSDRQNDLALFSPPASAQAVYHVTFNSDLPNRFINIGLANRMGNR